MATKKTVKKKVQYLGTGRRKTAIARVRLIPGEGNITINKRAFEDYFPLDTMRLIVNQPLEAVSATDKFDVIVNVHGGGMTHDRPGGRHPSRHRPCPLRLRQRSLPRHFEEGRLSQARPQTERAQEIRIA